MTIKYSMTILWLSMATFLSHCGEKPADSQTADTDGKISVGLYQDERTGAEIELKLGEFSFVTLFVRMGPDADSIIPELRLTASEYEALFENSQNATAKVGNLGFENLITSTVTESTRTISIVHTWHDTDTDPKIIASRMNATLVFEQDQTVRIKGKHEHRIGIGNLPTPFWRTKYETDGFHRAAKVKEGLGLYGLNSGVKFGRILSLKGLRLADPKTSGKKATQERLVRLCESECP